RVLTGGSRYRRVDSLAVEHGGNICVATLIEGGITVVAPDGSRADHVPMPDLYATNICFGGPDLRTAFITLSAGGRLAACDWPRSGLALNFPPPPSS
ncbi:MAG: SMP-30/gluconolactonase/LRE family protein, partial [Rhodospirillales bacterium]|nr:SMP-30/gluconolactonase/LRE family protein [Rhodospirillales bacterium]